MGGPARAPSGPTWRGLLPVPRGRVGCGHTPKGARPAAHASQHQPDTDRTRNARSAAPPWADHIRRIRTPLARTAALPNHRDRQGAGHRDHRTGTGSRRDTTQPAGTSDRCRKCARQYPSTCPSEGSRTSKSAAAAQYRHRSPTARTAVTATTAETGPEAEAGPDHADPRHARRSKHRNAACTAATAHHHAHDPRCNRPPDDRRPRSRSRNHGHGAARPLRLRSPRSRLITGPYGSPTSLGRRLIQPPHHRRPGMPVHRQHPASPSHTAVAG